MEKIKVLVVDDSALMRKLISDMISEDNDIEVISTARNGEDLINKLNSLKPDVITLDVEMPKMNGVETLKELKSKDIHIPVIMVSSITTVAARITIDCLHNGAFDFVSKPSGSISLDIDKVKKELIEKIRLAYQNKNKVLKHRHVSWNTRSKLDGNTSNTKNISNTNDTNIKSSYNSTHTLIKRNNRINKNSKIDAVVIGASTGGPKALYKVITNLPQDLGVPVLVVQHMPAGFTKAFADRLDLNSKLKVLEAQDNMFIEKNTVYIAPGGYHMEVGNDGKIHLNTQPTIWGVRPAVDKLFISASEVYGSRLLSSVLTGMGKDGANGTVAVKEKNGVTFAEDESTCVIYGMPKVTYETGKVDYVIPLDKMALNISKVVLGS